MNIQRKSLPIYHHGRIKADIIVACEIFLCTLLRVNDNERFIV